MTRLSTRPKVDPGLVLCLLLTLFLALPVMRNAGLPNSAETQLHVTDGGLAYILASSIQGVFSLGALVAGRGLLLLCFALCSGGMYAFCKRRSGRLGALIAGLVYVYSPYLMFGAPYARGAYGELLALALFPLLLWLVDALRDKPQPASFLLVCLVQVALLHAHLATALTLTSIACAWLLVETLIQLINREASQMRARSGALAGMALLLGLLASSSLWLPMEEAEAAGVLVYQGNSVPLEDLLAPPPIQDTGAINGLRELPNLGPAQWALAGLGALAALLLYIGGYRTRHPNAFLGTAFFAGLGVLLINLMLPAAAGLWSGWPLLQKVGAPSRLLGPTAACLAIVASMNGLWLSRLKSRYQISTIALLIAAPIVTVIPLLYVPEGRPSLESAAGLREPVIEVSALAAAVALLLATIAIMRSRSWQLTPRPYWTAPALSRTSLLGVLLGAAITLLSLLITFREGVAWHKSPPGQALPAQVQAVAVLSDGLQLLGYDLSAEAFRPGDSLAFTAYWYAHERPEVDFSSFLYLSGDDTIQPLASRRDPAGLPTSAVWGPEGYIVDAYQLRLPVDLPVGEYELIIGLVVCDRLPLADCAPGAPDTETAEMGEALGGSAVITSIRIAAP